MKIQRIVAIVTMLLQREKISANELSEKFEVSTRTIYRDIETIESAGIPIVSYPGFNGGFGILDSYKIDKKLFTNDDISTLLTSLGTLSGSISDRKLNQTLEKIKSLIPQEKLSSIQLNSKQLYIDISPWASNPITDKTLSIIKIGLEKNLLIKLIYTGRESNEMERLVEPHQLILKENTWYLRAFCRGKNAFRVFKINRMKNVELTEQHFEPRDFSSEMTDFKNWKSDRLITVDILMEESYKEKALDYVREECLEPAKNGKILVHMPFVESELGYNLLLGLGPKCECIGPTHVREKLMEEIEKLRKVYIEK